MGEAVQSQMEPMFKVLLFRALSACELTYLEIEAVCKVDVVCSIHPSMKFRVQSGRDAEITNLKG